MARTVVHLVRHGEVFNPGKILYGRLPDFHLSSRGRSMAARTATSFKGHDVTYLAASPLERAHETAAPISEVVGMGIHTDPDLIEAGNTFEGLRTKGFPSQLMNPIRWRHMTNPLQPSWGEPYTEILARMERAVAVARTHAEGHEAVLVSHQLPIVMIQRSAAGKRLAHVSRQCELASVTSLTFDGDTLTGWTYDEPAKDI